MRGAVRLSSRLILNNERMRILFSGLATRPLVGKGTRRISAYGRVRRASIRSIILHRLSDYALLQAAV